MKKDRYTCPLAHDLLNYYAGSNRDLDVDRELHRREGGVLVENEELVLMARPVCLGADYEMIVSPECSFSQFDCDAWYLHLLIGSPVLIPKYVPGYDAYRSYAYIRGLRPDKRLHYGNVEKTIRYFMKKNKQNKKD